MQLHAAVAERVILNCELLISQCIILIFIIPFNLNKHIMEKNLSPFSESTKVKMPKICTNWRNIKITKWLKCKKKDLQILLINKTNFIKLSKLVLLNITKIYQIYPKLVVLNKAKNLANTFQISFFQDELLLFHSPLESLWL